MTSGTDYQMPCETGAIQDMLILGLHYIGLLYILIHSEDMDIGGWGLDFIIILYRAPPDSTRFFLSGTRMKKYSNGIRLIEHFVFTLGFGHSAYN